MATVNRETWLENATSLLRPWFEQKGFPLPDRILVSCGWPKRQGGKKGIVGQTFDPIWTEDGTAQIYICPTQSVSVRVLDILLHELCHTAVGVQAGHAGAFVELIRSFGLHGKATATRAEPGSPLHEALESASASLGPYPHSAMRAGHRATPTRKPAGGWIKFQSVTDPEYILRLSPKAFRLYGPPCDFSGKTMVKV